MLSGQPSGGRYSIIDGRLQTWSLEVQVVDHCNLRCASCCTRSPYNPARFSNPQVVEADLGRLARVLAPRVLKLTGGEPLLHPDLGGVIEAARRSQIAGRLSLTTNGWLLDRTPDEVLGRLDALTLSWYSSRPLPEGAVGRHEARLRALGVEVTVKPISSFQQVDPAGPTDAQRAWDSCWMRQRCHLVREGWFYTCTRPPHLGLPADGVRLEGPDLLPRLAAWLQRDAPTASCGTCLGNGGPILAHAQLSGSA